MPKMAGWAAAADSVVETPFDGDQYLTTPETGADAGEAADDECASVASDSFTSLSHHQSLLRNHHHNSQQRHESILL